MFIISFLLIYTISPTEAYTKNAWYCRGAYINITIVNSPKLINTKFDVLYQYKVCRECELSKLTSLETNDGKNVTKEVALESNYDYYFQVVDANTKEIICPLFEYDGFGECGLWSFDVINPNNCKFNLIYEPKNTYIYLYIAVAIILVIIIILNILEKVLLKRSRSKELQNIPVSLVRIQPRSDSLKTNEERIELAPTAPLVKKRVESLDAFRGFSLILMILVIYGWDGYPIIHHLPWHGLNIGTLVFPWFLFIMGFSIPLSVHSILKKPKSSKIKLLFKIFIRTLKMFGIGLILNTSWGIEIENLRIFGVLQRIAICYIFMASLETIFYKTVVPPKSKNKLLFYLSDFIWSSKQTIVVLLVNTAWFLITFLLEVPGCPKGYFGPGGIEYNSTFFNCTGGAAGYIDKIVLGSSHLYKTSTPMKIYKNGNYDPEGLLGTLTSIFLTYIGCQAGRALIFYKSHLDQLIIWLVWIIICLALFFGLTQGDMSDGLIPVNKNIWTFTFSLVSGATALGILFIFYVLIDIFHLWTGLYYLRLYTTKFLNIIYSRYSVQISWYEFYCSLHVPCVIFTTISFKLGFSSSTFIHCNIFKVIMGCYILDSSISSLVLQKNFH